MADEHDDHPETPDMVAAIALGAASREKADAFLEEQTVLARLQAEDLRREDKLRHWSLIVHHISDVLKLTFEFSIATILLGLVVLAVATVWNAAHDNALIIEAFSVPQGMAARGLTGKAISAQLQEKLAALQDATDSARPADSYSNNWGDNIEVQIPDTGVSVTQFYQLLVGWLGHQTRITGNVWRNGAAVSIAARSGADGVATVTGQEADFPALLQKTAEKIYAATQPYRYAVYLDDNGRSAQAQVIRQRLVNIPSERAWALNAMGLDAATHSDSEHAAHFFRAALAAEPHFVLAEIDLAADLYFTGQDEKALAEGRSILADLPNARGEISERARRILFPGSAASVDDMLGDYAGAVAEARTTETLPDYFNNVEFGRQEELQSLGALHDARAFAERKRVLPLPRRTDAASRLEAMAMGEFALGQWKMAQQDLAAAHAKLTPGDNSWTSPRTTALLAGIEAEQGDVADARALIQKTQEDCLPCVLARAQIEWLAGNPAAATHWYAIAARQAPSLPAPLYHWGQMLLREGDFDGAIAKFASANRKGPHFADPLEMWGEALIRKDRSDLALAKFAEADKCAPNWGRLHLKWGEALLWSGDKAGAAKQFAVAAHLDLTPSEKSELVKVRGA
jgi:tetratricopeptide (TPR) repeat protein